MKWLTSVRLTNFDFLRPSVWTIGLYLIQVIFPRDAFLRSRMKPFLTGSEKGAKRVKRIFFARNWKSTELDHGMSPLDLH